MPSSTSGTSLTSPRSGRTRTTRCTSPFPSDLRTLRRPLFPSLNCAQNQVRPPGAQPQPAQLLRRDGAVGLLAVAPRARYAARSLASASCPTHVRCRCQSLLLVRRVRLASRLPAAFAPLDRARDHFLMLSLLSPRHRAVARPHAAGASVLVPGHAPPPPGTL